MALSYMEGVKTIWKGSNVGSNNIVVRQADLRDLDRIVEVNNRAWGPGLESTKEDFMERFSTFPEGEIGAYIRGRLVGLISSLMIKSDSPEDVPPSWAEVTDNGKIRNSHDSDGNSLVCFSAVVDPEVRGMNIGRLLVNAQLDLAKRLGLKRVYAYSRPASYRYFKRKFYPEFSDEKFLKEVPIERYLALGKDGQPRKEGDILFDIAIGMHISNGARLVRIIPHGRIEDKEAYGYNVLLEYSP